IECWSSAVAAGDPAWQRAARANLAAWRPHYRPLKAGLSHTSPVVNAAFGPNNSTVISSSIDRKAPNLGAASGKKNGPLVQLGGQFFLPAFSPDGRTVLTGAEGHTARVRDATTGEPHGPPLHLRPQDSVLGVAILRDGTIVLAGSVATEGNILRCWDA